MKIIDTITAVITPPGRSSVGIIRISGSLAALAAKKILGKIPEIRIAEYMSFYDSYSKIIDKGIVLFFSKPNSFTGEDVLELHGHGNPIILDAIMNHILSIKGIRLAKEGEFSERAFLNEKLDLTQAEAIDDLIKANSIQAANLAIGSFKGNFSEKIKKLTEKFNQLRINIELNIDFSDKEIKKISFFKIKDDIKILINEIKNLIFIANKNKTLFEGLNIIILGEPNVGKSSIFNILTGDTNAIVTNIPGTTRDILSKEIYLNGILINIIDTAGFQDPKDEIEKIGIEYALKKIKTADHLLFVTDARQNTIDASILKFLNLRKENKISSKILYTIIRNKADLINENIIRKEINNNVILTISAKLEAGFDLLYNRLKEININNCCMLQEHTFLVRKRHLFALKKVQKHLLYSKEHFLYIDKIDLLAEELKLAQKFISEIIGKFNSEELLKQIFSQFCIGK